MLLLIYFHKLEMCAIFQLASQPSMLTVF